MRTALPHRPAQHSSYKLHRRQRWTQILLPILFAVLAFIVLGLLVVHATFGGKADVGRWAAISTIWLVLPAMLVAVIALAALCGALYLLTRLIGLLPTYTSRAQRIFYRLAGGTRRADEMTRRPVLFARGFGSLIKGGFHRLRERM